MSLGSWLPVGMLTVLTAAPPAQQPKVGDPAPAIVANDWLNWEGDAPSLSALQGRVVMIEFWGTWCGPCVRAMPGIQKLHDRFGEQGLTVLAISYESPDKMQPFLKKHAYTMPVGSDPEKKTIGAYGVSGWPMTVVIDKEGKVAHVGTPYSAEAAVEKALGLEAGPGALLNAYLESTAAEKDTQRQALERLAAKAPTDFDLRAWAKSHLAPDTVAGEGEEHEEPQPAKGPAKLRHPDKALQQCIKAWQNESKREKLLQQLGDAGPTEFDLADFARTAFAKAKVLANVS